MRSLPALMLGGGAESEVENAMMMGLLNQRRANRPVASRYCSVYARTGAAVANNASNKRTALKRLPVIGKSVGLFHMTMCSVSSLTAQILLRGWPAFIVPLGGKGLPSYHAERF